jgi:hypothetical protein
MSAHDFDHHDAPVAGRGRVQRSSAPATKATALSKPKLVAVASRSLSIV